METHKSVIGKIFYAILFLLIVPLLQWWWAVSAKDFVTYPAIHSSRYGITIAASGFLFMLDGMFALMKFGKGLPMNAYPPETFVNKGPYVVVSHPIYFGYAFMMIGISIYFGSASGLWLVTPISILAMVALVIGYENPDLKKRFPNAVNKAFLKIPSANNTIRRKERLASLLLTFLLFICANYIIHFLAGNTNPFLQGIPSLADLHEISIFQYLIPLFIFIAPLVLKEKYQLRHWTISVLIALSLSLYISLLLPAIGAQYFHIIPNHNSIITVTLSMPLFLTFISANHYLQCFRSKKFTVIVFAIIICFFELLYSRSFPSDFFVSIFIFLVADNYTRIWIWLKNLAEKIANSWQEWVFGYVRIINRGFYTGLGAFLVILFGGLFLGKAYAWAILVYGCVDLVCAALWAQIIEGSDKLKRPFGYYGAVVGVIFASLVVWGMGYDIWVLLGIFSVSMPWAQAAGRIGCLVNGCCHGSKTTNSNIGIRYFHPRSRVCGLSHMKGELLHPTQLYSIIWLTFVGFIMLAFWFNQFSYSFIFGMYLILTGLGRFVEEAYRGEIQTPVIKGLRLYQWAAICTFLIGIYMTTIHIHVVQVYPDYGWQIWLAALLGGIFSLFAMGIDFPYSNIRFSRLV